MLRFVLFIFLRGGNSGGRTATHQWTLSPNWCSWSENVLFSCCKKMAMLLLLLLCLTGHAFAFTLPGKKTSNTDFTIICVVVCFLFVITVTATRKVSFELCVAVNSVKCDAGEVPSGHGRLHDNKLWVLFSAWQVGPHDPGRVLRRGRFENVYWCWSLRKIACSLLEEPVWR